MESIDDIKSSGKAFVYGDDINTDILAPGAYLKLSVEEMAKHCLESLDPNFVSNVNNGDIIVAGKNFGVGSSREQAAASLLILGIKYVLAENFARIFYRNAFNLGLIPIICKETRQIRNGDMLSIDPKKGIVDNLSKKEKYFSVPVPNHLMKIVEAGGLLADLKKNIENKTIKNARFRKIH